MSGNGHVALTRPIRATAPRPVRSVNTTANSCATNTSCAGALARLRNHISAPPIGIFSNPKNAGNSPACVSPATSNEPSRQWRGGARPRAGRVRFSRRSYREPFQLADNLALEVFLRRARLRLVPTKLRAARILYYSYGGGDLARAWRGNGGFHRRECGDCRLRHWRRDQNPHAPWPPRKYDRLCAGRYFQTAPDGFRCRAATRDAYTRNSTGLRRLLATAAIATLFAQTRSCRGLFSRFHHRESRTADRAGFFAPGLPIVRTQRRISDWRRSAKVARDPRSGLQRQHRRNGSL